MVLKELLNIGLSQKEAEVYLATLQLGHATVKKIAEKAEINRTTTYTHVRNLISRGLLTGLERNGKQYYLAEKPTKLQHYYEQQAMELQRRKDSLDKIMPELELLHNVDSSRPSVRFYGKDSMKLLQQEILKSRGDEYVTIYNHEKFKQYLNKSHLQELLSQTNSYKHLYVAPIKVLDRKLHAFRNHEAFRIKFLPLRDFNFSCHLTVSDKETFIAREHDALVIKDSFFSQTMKILFNAMWGMAEAFD